IVLGGQEITQVPAHKRDIGLVFQSYALFPHLSAFDNVAFGLRLRRVAEPELRRRVDEALASVGLAEYAPRLPAQLSGGQQQRVALARAMVIRPRLLLLDEPLSNLDAALRLEMRAEVRRLQRAAGVTMLYVTHDQDEALALSDRIVVMKGGRIEQDAPPDQVFDHPATPFVAAFMGCENLFEWRDGALVGREGRWLLPAAAGPVAAGSTHLAWRPGAVPVVEAGGGAALDARRLDGNVLARSYLGDAVQYLVGTVLGPVKGVAAADARWQEGDTVAVELDPARAAAIAGPVA
ncbi:MAG: ABC transporter ATP-binding protein, partial [Comamonadaceae bacterium]|nr:ABC transporter ATP-binding protein [Comamonadaceae bacterium]